MKAGAAASDPVGEPAASSHATGHLHKQRHVSSQLLSVALYVPAHLLETVQDTKRSDDLLAVTMQ